MKVRDFAGKAVQALTAATTNTRPPAAQRAPEPRRVSFDPADGKRRVLIAVNPDGTFEPPAWYGMHVVGSDSGVAEANVIAQHGALILAEEVVRRLLAPGASDGK